MHHIAGDLNSPQNSYLPSILKSFSKIWEQVIIPIIILITIITILAVIASKFWEEAMPVKIHFDNSHTRKNLINGPMAGLII